MTDGYVGRHSNLMDRLNSPTNFFNDYGIRHQYNVQEQGTIQSPNGTILGLNSEAGFRFILDRIPDQFSLSVAGLSAKFILNYEDDQPLIQKYDDLVVSYTLGQNGISSFEVTDKDGYIFSFDVSNWQSVYKNYVLKLDGTYDQSDPENTDPRINNTWLLTKIESPDGEKAEFIYTEEIYEQFSRSYDTRIMEMPQNCPVPCVLPPINEAIRTYASHNFIHENQLTEIRYNFKDNNFDKIEFVSNDSRLDLKTGAFELDKIRVYSRNQLIKTVNLHQSYKDNINDNNQNYHLKSFEPESSKRLFLDSLTEESNGSFKPPYVFKYNAQSLPNRFSTSQDLWGYFNGAQNGQFLLFMHQGVVTGPIDRTVDTLKSQAGMLEKIKYPTGGSVKFSYEHNRGKKGIEFSNVRYPKVNTRLIKTLSISSSLGVNMYNNSTGVYLNETDNNDGIITNDDIVSRSLVIPSLSLPANINGYNQNDRCIINPLSGCYFSVKLVPVVNGVPQMSDAKQLYSDSTPFWINPGKYQLIVDPPLNWDPNIDYSTPAGQDKAFLVSLTIYDQTVSEDELLFASGKRIKQIEFLDSQDNVVSKKLYEYKNEFGEESGVILSIPAFGSLAQLPGIPSTGSANMENNTIYSEEFGATPGGPYSTYQGNTIGYEYVKEFNGDANSNTGYVSYNFLVPRDSDDHLNYPITPPTDNEWLRGLPKFIRVYKNDNGIYKIVKETENSYLYGDELLSSKMMPISLKKDLSQDVTQADINSHPLGLTYDISNTKFRLPLVQLFNDPYASYKIYHFTGGTLDTWKSIERNFDDNENLTLETETITSFDYSNHYQPKSIKSVTSDGLAIMESFTYPQELISNFTIHPTTYSTNPIQALAEQNRVMPIETKVFKDINNDGFFGFPSNLETVSTKNTEYAWFPINSEELLKPSKVLTSIGGETPEERIEFEKYDIKGNILQVSQTDGMKIAYVWGYDKTYPIAKLENATLDTQNSAQQTALTAAISSSNQDTNDVTEDTLRTKLNDIRIAFPDAMVTTYTYDPLIGVTSMTDPKGYTVYYEYDDLNRLKRVLDSNGNVLSENKYNYLLDN